MNTKHIEQQPAVCLARVGVPNGHEYCAVLAAGEVQLACKEPGRGPWWTFEIITTQEWDEFAEENGIPPESGDEAALRPGVGLRMLRAFGRRFNALERSRLMATIESEVQRGRLKREHADRALRNLDRAWPAAA